jgi:FlaA1/EpsC-like NDP-sugar epimerase
MKNLIIIGAGIAGRMVARDVLENKKISRKYNLIGFLDDDNSKKTVDNIKVLGKISDSEKVIKENNIDEVIISIPSAGKDTVNKIIDSLYKTSVEIKIVPGLFEIIEGKVKFSQIRNFEASDLLGREEVGFDIDKISNFYKDKTVFVTGAGGSIGSEIFIQLLELPVKKVIAFGHGENSIHSLITKVGSDRRFNYVIGDVKDFLKVKHELSRFSPDIVFHAAAHKHVPLMEVYPDEAVKNNIFGTYNVARASIETGVKNFILVSTDKAVNPTSIMGASKRIAEKTILSLNKAQNTTKFQLTRFGNVLGSRGSVIPIFKEQIEAGGPITVTHKDIERYFMSIREAARLVIKSASIKDGTIFVLDMGKAVKIVDLAKNLVKLCGYTEDEIPIVFTGLRPGEKMYEELLTKNENLKISEFDKLFISHESENIISKKEFETMIEEFKTAADNFDNEKIRFLIKKYVPEFITL